MRFVTRRPVRTAASALSLFTLLAVSPPLASCTISYAAAVANDPASHVKQATLVVAGRTTSVQRDPNGDVIARLAIDKVFKGDAPGSLIVRANYKENPCRQFVPPESEAFYAFLISTSSDGKTFTQVGFVRQSAMTENFVRQLGKARTPRDDADR
jgi:hypothetical protein